MKIVVIGGTGLIGSKVVHNLTEFGHEAVAASPNTGVNTLTGEGLDAALEGAQVVIDVSNSPSFEDAAVLEFFTTATTNLMKAEAGAGVGHHVALSVVNNDQIPDSGYLRAKAAQERIIRESGLVYSIVRATQFFEFSQSIAQTATVDGVVRLPAVQYQPIAAEDVAAAVGRVAVGSPLNGKIDIAGRVAVGSPLNGKIDIAGPTSYRFNEFIEQALAAQGARQEVVADPSARYFGAQLDERSLVPGDDAQVGATSYAKWLATQPGK
jgi:uncharacterized protein YbjT (DUF2867 family)